MDDHTNDVALIRNLRRSLTCVAHFLTCYPGVFVLLTLTDVRSTGAGNKCLYCILATSRLASSK